MAGKEKMRVSEYKKNRAKIEPESKEYQEIRKMEEENIREIPKDMAKNALRLIGMKSGGRVTKYAGGGMKKADMTQRRQKTKQMPKPAGRPPAKSKQMPKPAGRGMISNNTAGMIANKAKPAKSKSLPKPVSRRLAKIITPTLGAKVFKGAAKGPGMKAGGGVKKMAAGGMIPKAGKKSPDSMGTSYRSGGAIDGCAMKGKTRAKRVK